MSKDSSDLWAAALRTLDEGDRNLVTFDGQHKLEVLSDLGQLVTSARKKSIEKRWRFHRPGSRQTVILHDLFSKIVVWIDRFKAIGDIVVQYDPVHAALPWAGIRFLLQLAVSDINKFAFIVEGAETIARSISRYATFEQIYLPYNSTASRAMKRLKDTLVRLYAAILIYLAKAKRYFEEPTPKRVLKAALTSQSDFEELLRNIDKHTANVDHEASLVDAERSSDISNTLVSLSIDDQEMHAKLRELLQSIDSPIRRMSPQVDSLQDHLKHTERVEILRWLSSQPYLEHHQQIKKQALPGSGQWLLQDPQYIKWYEQSASSLLWLHGKQGSGKSTLVSLVVEDMIKRFEASQSALPVYFYCTRSAAEPERSKPDTVLASILRQLSCVQPDAPLLSPMIEKYKIQGEGFKSNGLGLDDSRDLIIRLIKDHSMTMTIIVVDALDECDAEMRQSLLDAFEHILKESVGLVKIFVSSRDDQDIVCTLRRYPNLDISSDKNTADIEAYVKTEAQKLVNKGQLLRNSRAKEEMTALIIDQVCKGADGMFRWASLQLGVLRPLIRDEDIRAQLGRLPPKLEQLYVEAYNNLISRPGEVCRSIIDNALKWLLCAREEMHASEFLVAVAANLKTFEGDISGDSLLELCNNFVVYDEGLDIFRFAHLSVREFLEKIPAFAEVSCYTLAAECCLLQMVAYSNCPVAEQLMSDLHCIRLRGSSGSTKPSSCAEFLGYANTFWFEYCQQIPQCNRSDDTQFGRIFRFSLSDKLGSGSPLNAWVQWHCNRIITGRKAEAHLKLRYFLIRCSDSLSISFLVAAYFGFSEIITLCVRNQGLGDETKDQGLILAALAAHHEAFDIIREDRKDWVVTEPVLFHAVRASDKERLASLLDEAPDNIITNRLITAIAKDRDDGKLTTLLERYPGFAITEGLLEVALEYASQVNFRLLVDRAAEPTITQSMLQMHGRYGSGSVFHAYLEKMVILLDKVAESGLTPRLMAFAARESYHERVIEAMLERGGAGNITAQVMIEAARRGGEIFHLMLRHGGKITDTVLDVAASNCDAQLWQVLLEQGYESSINMKRLKLAALNDRHGDAVLSLFLDHVDDTTIANEMPGLIHQVARVIRVSERMRQLLDRAKDVRVSQDMLLAATSNRTYARLGIVKMFLERSSEVQITEDMLLVAAGHEYQGMELIQMFLERRGEADISELVLMAAACNRNQGSQVMQLLLEQDRAADLTEDVLICAAQYSNVDLVLEILERSEIKRITEGLLIAAAANGSYGGELVRLLLARAEITDFPENVLVEAVENDVGGTKVIQVLEETFGRISMTESLLAKCVHRAAPGTVELLLNRTDPAQITKEVLIGAMSNSGYHRDIVQRAVTEKSLHVPGVPVTADVLRLAAEYGPLNLDLFGFFWNRRPPVWASVQEDLINAAARNNDVVTFDFLLDKSDCVEIGEETMRAIVANMRNANTLFDLLLQQGLQADTKEGVPETLLMNGGIRVKCSSPTLLRLSSGLKVTEDLFRIAASGGDEKFLQTLSEFCGLKSTPEKWLDIARLRNAVLRGGDIDLLKALIGRGVEPDVAAPNGETPLVVAVRYGNELAVQILLAAGALPDGGPMLKYSPLCDAAERGAYDIVKILVNAGASLNFRDHKGRTPPMIAKENRCFRVFKYLEQCRAEQDKGGRETPETT